MGRWALLAMAPALILSILVARADYLHAFTARKAAGEIGQALSGMSDRAWFRGHWGFQYYMERLGMKPFDKYVSRVGTGDFIVVPDNNSNNEPLPVKRAILKDRYVYDVVCCLSTMNLESGAGFYSHFWGNLPFRFGTAPKEGYQIFQVR
jgi:hypothetical protein